MADETTVTVKEEPTETTKSSEETMDTSETSKNGDDTGKDAGEKEEAAAKPEPKVFKYKDVFNATAEEHENSQFIWIKTRNLLTAVTESLEKTQEAMKAVFEDKLQVAVPKLKLPPQNHLYVELKSKEDKFKVLSETSRPEKWDRRGREISAPNIITQSVVVRQENLPKGEPGTLQEALDVLLPHRNMLYKEQLAIKTKQLDETVEEVFKLTKESLSKGRSQSKVNNMEKPATGDVAPMVPNVGYERNVTLDLQKDLKGKIIAGIRVQYEKDGVQKVFLVPISECSHVAPQIVKAAEALTDHLSAGKFGVYDGVSAERDLFSLKITMSDIGEIIISAVLCLDDKFLDEFYDLSNNDTIPQEAQNYFSGLKTKGVKAVLQDSQDNGDDAGEDGDAGEGADEDGDADGEKAKVEKTAGDTKPVVEPKQEEKKEVEESAKKEEDEGIVILRESNMRPLHLNRSAFLKRVEEQIRDQLERFLPSLKSFFEQKGGSLGVSGIYITWYTVNKRPSDWNRDWRHWYHVCGSEGLTETINNVKLDLYPHLEGHHPSRFSNVSSLMNVIIDNLGLDTSSQVVVACDHYFVQSLFAQKCKKTVCLSYMSEVLRNDLKSKFQDKVSFVSAKAKQFNIIEKCRRFFGDPPQSLIHWGQFHDLPIKKLFQHRVKKVAVVIDPRVRKLSNAEAIKKMNMFLHSNYNLKKVVGIDICPQREGQLLLVGIYEATGGFIYNIQSNFNNRGIKRRNQHQGSGPGNKRSVPSGGPSQGARQGSHNNGRGSGMAGGNRQYFGGKRPNDGNRRPPPGPSMGPPRTPGNRGGLRFQRGPDPWNDSRRFGNDAYNGRSGGGSGGFSDPPEAEHTVQAAKAVLSQLNSIIENQLMLAHIKGPAGARGRPDDSWVGSGRRENFGGGRDGPSSFANDQDYFSRDRSPPNFGNPRGGFGDTGRNYFGGGGGGGNSSGGGMGRRGPPMSNRRGGGGGGGGSGSRFNRRN